MLRPFLTSLTLLGPILCGCSGSEDPPEAAETDTDVEAPADTDTDTDTDTDVETDVETDSGGDTDVGFDVTFRRGTYKVTSLRLRRPNVGTDLDGNGTPDNLLASLLPIINGIGLDGDLSLDGVNTNIEEMLTSERTVVLLEAVYDDASDALTFDVVIGSRDEGGIYQASEASYDDNGDPVSRLMGTFTSPEDAEAGPGPVTLPLQFYSDEPVLLIQARNALASGRVAPTEITRGRIAGGFLVDAVMADIVEPLVIGFYGEGEEADGYIALADDILRPAADLTVGGEPAISASFTFTAEFVSWLPPATAP